MPSLNQFFTPALPLEGASKESHELRLVPMGRLSYLLGLPLLTNGFLPLTLRKTQDSVLRGIFNCGS